METLYPDSYMSNSNWFLQESSQSTSWTKEENKRFESALAIYSESTPDRWIKVAAMIPGKTVLDVIKQYKELEEDVSDIESGKIPLPAGYLSSSFTLEMGSERDCDTNRKRPLVAKSSDHERKKGVPWTQEEHKRFLMGLIKCGKGDWRNISRNYVISKTSTQVASHAQKYFIRQLSGGKEKRRPSIHDITIVKLPSFDQSNVFPTQHKSLSIPKVGQEWTDSNNGAVLASNATHSNMLMPSANEFCSHGIKIPAKDLYATTTAYHGAHLKPRNPLF